MAQVTAERDWPVGHPSAGDYAGEKYTPPPAALCVDWTAGHPKAANSAANIAEGIARVEDEARKYPGRFTAAEEQEQPSELEAVLAAGKTALEA